MEQHPPAPRSAICKWVVLVNAAQYIERETRIAPAGTMHSTKKSQLDTRVEIRWKGMGWDTGSRTWRNQLIVRKLLTRVRNRSIYIEPKLACKSNECLCSPFATVKRSEEPKSSIRTRCTSFANEWLFIVLLESVLVAAFVFLYYPPCFYLSCLASKSRANFMLSRHDVSLLNKDASSRNIRSERSMIRRKSRAIG